MGRLGISPNPDQSRALAVFDRIGRNRTKAERTEFVAVGSTKCDEAVSPLFGIVGPVAGWVSRCEARSYSASTSQLRTKTSAARLGWVIRLR